MITVNQYDATFELVGKQSVNAATIEDAARVLCANNPVEPNIIQCIKKGILVEMPIPDVSFITRAEPVEAHAAGCVATPRQYVLPAGSKQVFTAVPMPGWAFSHWEINGIPVMNAEATALITLPASPVPILITAHFLTRPSGP